MISTWYTLMGGRESGWQVGSFHYMIDTVSQETELGIGYIKIKINAGGWGFSRPFQSVP